MAFGETYVKELEASLKALADKLKEDLGAIRSNRPSVDLVENIRVNVYDQDLPVKQLGSISVVPPRGLLITVWDKNAVGAIMKAIEGAKMGLSTSNDGNTIRANLSPLGEERRAELVKLVGKTSEGIRIQVRARRDEAMKKINAGEDKKEMTEDEAWKTKEKIEKHVKDTNERIERMVGEKLTELAE